MTMRPSTLSHAEFLEVFGKVFENAPWVAELAWQQGIKDSHNNIDNLHGLLAAIIRAASAKTQAALIAGHPRLAAKVPMTEACAASRGEQDRAGLASLDTDQQTEFASLNTAYEQKFGFPFILAVEGLDAATILAQFRQRLTSDDMAGERTAALEQIIRIGRLRLNKL